MRDLKYRTDFGEGKRVEFSTGKIKGYLESIYLSVTKPVSVIIYSMNNPDIILFEDVDFVGSKNLNLRAEAMGYDHKVFNYANTRWALNERLGFIFKGSVFTKVEVRVRYNG